jgi:hypothetical protein
MYIYKNYHKKKIDSFIDEVFIQKLAKYKHV